MPPKVRGLLFLTAAFGCCGTIAFAQQQQSAAAPAALNAAPPVVAAVPVVAAAPTASDKLVRVRALIAARQLPTAALELEKIRKETGDDALQSVARTMLVGVYLEMPNYERAKDLIEETYKRNKNRKSGAENIYLPVAGQVIRGAENQLERYKKLGFNLSDPKLPGEAAADLDRWRKMLETIVEQSKQMSTDEKKSAESLAVLEQAANVRGLLARDEYEAGAWRHAMEDTREMIANAQTKVTDVDGATVDMKNTATINLPAPTAEPVVSTATAPVGGTPTFEAVKTSAETTAAPANNLPNNTAVNSVTANNTTPDANSKTSAASPNTTAPPRKVLENAGGMFKEPDAVGTAAAKTPNNGLMQVASLVDLATRKYPAAYPPTAKSARIGGIVKVEVIVDEQGSVTDVKTTDGPEMLRRAASDAVRRWKFKPATRDGQPVRMTGYVNFNFSL